MIAYFILVHRYPEQFKRMFRAIYEPGNQYLIHIDKSSGSELATDIAAFIAPYSGAEILPAKKAQWGGYSLVDAELRGMERLLEMDDKWTHYINLSGQDFPLKSQGYIRDFVTHHRGKKFIRARDQRTIRPDTINRLSHYFYEGFGRIVRTGIPRRYLRNARPWIGTQWKVVDRAFCTFVTSDPSVARFRRFYRRSFIADEAFFQTVMMNIGAHGSVVNDDLRTIDWVPGRHDQAASVVPASAGQQATRMRTRFRSRWTRASPPSSTRSPASSTRGPRTAAGAGSSTRSDSSARCGGRPTGWR